MSIGYMLTLTLVLSLVNGISRTTGNGTHISVNWLLERYFRGTGNPTKRTDLVFYYRGPTRRD